MRHVVRAAPRARPVLLRPLPGRLEPAQRQRPPAETGALGWSITAMRETTGRLLRTTDWDRANGFAVISEAVWWVTMVDATLMRYHPDIHSRVLAGQDPGQCRMTEDTFAGLRVVRNRMGYDTDPTDFIQPLASHPAARQPSRRWPHRGLDLAASTRTRARIAHAARAGLGDGAIPRLPGPAAGQPIGETFSQATAFLNLAAKGSSLSRA